MFLKQEADSASTAYDWYAEDAKFLSQLSQHSKLYNRGVQIDRLREPHFKGQLTQHPWINQIKYLSSLDSSLFRSIQLKQVICSYIRISFLYKRYQNAVRGQAQVHANYLNVLFVQATSASHISDVR